MLKKQKNTGNIKKKSRRQFADITCIKFFSGFKCRICLTFHNNIKSFWNHVKGKRHIENSQYYRLSFSTNLFQNQIFEKASIKHISFSFRILRVAIERSKKKIIIIQFQDFYKNFNFRKIKFPQNSRSLKESEISLFLVFPGTLLKLNQILFILKKSKFSKKEKREQQKKFFSIGYFFTK